MKWCYKCKTSKPKTKFGKDKSRKDGLNNRCNSCNTIHVREIAARQKKQLGEAEYRKLRRKYELPHYYGITTEEYEKLTVQQDNKCAICRTNPEAYLAIDHCHITGKIRGLLCRKCNSAIGLLNEDPTRIKNVLKYLTQ